MKTRCALLVLGLAALGGDAWAANRPSGFTTICREGQTCSVPANTSVAFGRADRFLFRVLSGSFACAPATFGGRTDGGVNECSVPTGSTPTPTPGPDPSPTPSPDLGFFPGCQMPTPTQTVQLTA